MCFIVGNQGKTCEISSGGLQGNKSLTNYCYKNICFILNHWEELTLIVTRNHGFGDLQVKRHQEV